MGRVEEIEQAIQSLSPEEFTRVAQRVQALQQLRADVHAGFEAIKGGDYEDFDERSTKKLADDTKRRGRLRLAETRMAERPKKTRSR
jgi:hypothetical protein